jgi:hypothetical protein
MTDICRGVTFRDFVHRLAMMTFSCRLTLPLLAASLFVSGAAAQTRPSSPAPQIIETLPPRVSPRAATPMNPAPTFIPGTTFPPPTSVLPTISPAPGTPTVTGDIEFERKTVYKNCDAHFQFGVTQPTVCYTLWHRVCDPHTGCETVVPRTYLTQMRGIYIADPNYSHWKNVDQIPHEIEWAISRCPADDCGHYVIYYRRPLGKWCLYGYFTKDHPQ